MKRQLVQLSKKVVFQEKSFLLQQSFGFRIKVMKVLYKEGKIRAIGVSNFYPDRLVDLILNNEVVPAVNQVENHPFFQQKAAKKVMEEYGVQIQSWGQFAEGQNNIFKNELLSGIGAKYGKTVE